LKHVNSLILPVADFFEAFRRAVLLKYTHVLYFVSKGVGWDCSQVGSACVKSQKNWCCCATPGLQSYFSMKSFAFW